MAKRGLIIIIVLVILVVPIVSALSLAGPKLGIITYQPGLSITNHYSIRGTDKPVEVSIDSAGRFAGLSVSEVVDGEFDLIISFPPDQYVPPGSYTIGLTVKEVSPPEDGISSQVAVSKNFEVVVYSYDKDIQASLYAPSINQGKNITFQLAVRSMGYLNIDEVYGKINLFNSTRGKLGSIETERKPLPGLGSISFAPIYDTRLFPSGNYHAEAFVFYDGKYKAANTTFLIGIMDLILNNYTAELYPGFNEFEIIVTNGWGNGLRNVYATLFINATEIVQTPSIDLNPWEQGTLKAITNIEFPPGKYDALLQLYFEGEMKEVPLTLTILPPLLAEPSREMEKELQMAKISAFLPAALSALIILVLIGIYLLGKRKKRADEF